jgi:hypothetical protein
MSCWIAESTRCQERVRKKQAGGYNRRMRAQLSLLVSLSVLAGFTGCKQADSRAQGPRTAAPVSGSGARAVADGARSSGAAAGVAPAGGGRTFTGIVAETMSAGGYTYARLQSGGHAEVWIAAPEFAATVGEQISASLDTPMQNFESPTLHRTFPLVYFVADVGRDGDKPVAARPGAPPALMTSHGATSTGPAPAVAKTDPPPGGLSIAEVFAKRGSLSGRRVTVRGTVVKFNGGILDRNWIHIQDGSGSSDANDHDLTITTDAPVAVGDVVTASGVLETNRDFGARYTYEAILEKATITK